MAPATREGVSLLSSSHPNALHRYAVLTTIAAFLLLIAGSLVTSTDSGLAVPDWPLSYGTWFPPMVGGILYEHGHRLIAGVVGLMILGLAGWLWKAEPRAWVRRLGYAAAAAVVIQAMLGGLTVLLLLPAAVSIAHACLGQTVFCLTAALASCTAPRWEASPVQLPETGRPPLPQLGLVVAGLAAAQLALGAVIRHTGRAVHLHIAGAVLFTLALSSLAGRAARLRRELSSDPQRGAAARELWRHAHRLTIVLTLQLVLGVLVFWHRGVLLVRTAHLAVGALVLVSSVSVAWVLRRHISS